MIRGRTRNPTPPRPWIPAFAGMVAVRGGTRPRAHRPPLRKQGSTASYYAAPRIHHRPGPGFLLSQESRAGAGRGPAPIDHPCESRGLPPLTMRRPVFTTATALDSCFRRNGCGQGRDAAPRPLTTPTEAGVYRLLLCGAPYSPRATALDSCFRRNGCGQGRDAAPRPLTTPAKAGVYRFLLRGASYSPPPRPWIPAFAGMVAGGLTLTLPGQASLALHGGAVRAAPAGTSADCAVSRKPCPPADPLRCVSGSWGSPSATGPSGRIRR